MRPESEYSPPTGEAFRQWSAIALRRLGRRTLVQMPTSGALVPIGCVATPADLAEGLAARLVKDVEAVLDEMEAASATPDNARTLTEEMVDV